MVATITVKVEGEGLKQLQKLNKTYAYLQHTGVVVGIRGDAMSDEHTIVHKAKEVRRVRSGNRMRNRTYTVRHVTKIPQKSILRYALINEYGAPNIPARPFIRPTAQTWNAGAASRVISLRVYNYFRSKKGKRLYGKELANYIWKPFGEKVKNHMKQLVLTAKPPNAPSTSKRKARWNTPYNQPLMEWGALYNAIDYHVYMQGDDGEFYSTRKYSAQEGRTYKSAKYAVGNQLDETAYKYIDGLEWQRRLAPLVKARQERAEALGIAPKE